MSATASFADALVVFAVGMVSVFLVITVTSMLRIEVTLFGYRLRPRFERAESRDDTAATTPDDERT